MDDGLKARIRELAAWKHIVTEQSFDVKRDGLVQARILAGLEAVGLGEYELERVVGRIRDIIAEETARARNEHDALPFLEGPGDEISRCEEMTPGGPCNRPVTALGRVGNSVGFVCAFHAAAYERAIERIDAEFGDDVWSVVPFDYSVCVGGWPGEPLIV